MILKVIEADGEGCSSTLDSEGGGWASPGACQQRFMSHTLRGGGRLGRIITPALGA